MGYNTNYGLETTPPNKRREALTIFVRLGDGHDPFEEACKWYEHEDDVRTASKELPDVIIRIHGEGEDQGDEWIMYGFNGKVVKHKRPKWDPPKPPSDWIPDA